MPVNFWCITNHPWSEIFNNNHWFGGWFCISEIWAGLMWTVPVSADLAHESEVTCQVNRWLADLGWPRWEQLPFPPCGRSSPSKLVLVAGQSSIEQLEACKDYSWDVSSQLGQYHFFCILGTKAKQRAGASSMGGKIHFISWWEKLKVTLQRTWYREESRMTTTFALYRVTPYL